jgi:hypothetical protein
LIDFNPEQHYSAGYRPAARFLLWLAQNKASSIVDNLNRMIQNGTFRRGFLSELFGQDTFFRLTDQTLDSLWDEYTSSQQEGEQQPTVADFLAESRKKVQLEMSKNQQESDASAAFVKRHGAFMVAVGAIIGMGMGLALERAYNTRTRERRKLETLKDLEQKMLGADSAGLMNLTPQERKQLKDLIDDRRLTDRRRRAELNEKPTNQLSTNERNELNEIRVRKVIKKLL